jgi:uncharacterized protein DUF3987
LAPVDRLQKQARETLEALQAEHEVEVIVLEAREKKAKDALKAAVGDDDLEGIEQAKQTLKALKEQEAPPKTRRYSTSDATPEKLGELLRDNPLGLLNNRDELAGWIAALDRPGSEGARAFFLEAWTGTEPFDVDRIGRGEIHVPALCLSIFGGIQPGPMAAYVRSTLSNEERADGLLQRFQVLVHPDIPEYERVDEPPTPETKTAVFTVIERLADLDPECFGATVPESENSVPYVRFSKEAQAIFDEWRDEFEPTIRSGDYPEAVQAHLNKYRSLFASLALIFEVLEYCSKSNPQAPKAVGKTAALRAQVWCEFLKGHAMRLYHPGVMAPTLAAATLLDHIEEGDVEHNMKTRDIWHKKWQGLTTADELAQAIDVLEAHGWVRRSVVKPEGGGRPSERLLIHPSLRGES